MSPHEHITHIGNAGDNWRIPRDEAILRIEDGEEAYYTIDRSTGLRAYIGVVRTECDKAPYLRTYAKEEWIDSLLALGECNGDCRLMS